MASVSFEHSLIREIFRDRDRDRDRILFGLGLGLGHEVNCNPKFLPFVN